MRYLRYALLGLVAVGALVGDALTHSSIEATERMGMDGIHDQASLQSSSVDLSGTWSFDYEVGGFLVLGDCLATLTQADSSVSGDVSCTHASGGSLTGTLNGTELTMAVTFTSPAYVVGANASVSADGMSMSGTWQCTSGCAYSGILSGTRTVSNPPVLLVHGSGGNCSSLDKVRSFLESAGYTRIDCFGYNSRMGGWWSAYGLKRFVDGPDGFKSRMGMADGEEYYIVAHSFGGLVARYYAEEIGASQLGGIIMLGTPNGGAPEACAVRVMALDWWDMCLGSTFLTALNWGFDMQGRTYKGIAGTADNGRFVFNLVENDCIVYSWSVKGPLFNPLGFDVAKYNVRHATGFLCPGGGTTLLNDAGVLDDIVNTLNGAAGTAASSSDAAVQLITGSDALPAVPLLLSSSGSLTAGSAATESVTVESGLPSMTIRLLWPEDGGPAASLEVKRPNGLAVQPTDLDVVSWDSGAGGFAGLFMEELVIDSPASGDWEVTVRAAASPSGSVPYLLQVEPESDVALQVGPIVGAKVGQPVPVSATLLDGPVPVTPDTITASAVAPIGGASPISLTDNGSGTYEGSFVPDECGAYSVTISATVNVGGEVRRYYEAQVDIGLDGDAGGDPCDLDEDDDAFDDGSELWMGTDPLAPCAATGVHDGIDNNGDTAIDEPGEGTNDEDPDAWPPDADDDQDIDVGDILALFYGKIFTSAPGPPYQQRSDFDGDEDIDVGDVLIGFYGRIFTNCAP